MKSLLKLPETWNLLTSRMRKCSKLGALEEYSEVAPASRDMASERESEREQGRIRQFGVGDVAVP